MFTLLATGEIRSYINDPATPLPLRLLVAAVILIAFYLVGVQMQRQAAQSDADYARDNPTPTDNTHGQEEAANPQPTQADHQGGHLEGAPGQTRHYDHPGVP